MERLKEIQEEMLSLLEEAKHIVHRETGATSYSSARMKSYWYAQIKTALVNESEFISRSMCSMEDTINELDEDEDEDENEDS